MAQKASQPKFVQHVGAGRIILPLFLAHPAISQFARIAAPNSHVSIAATAARSKQTIITCKTTMCTGRFLQNIVVYIQTTT